MRARLLDLGEVGPVRSQSAYHAVLSRIAEDDDPVVFLVRPAGALVSVGDSGTKGSLAGGTQGSPEVDLQACLDRGTPVVRRLIGGPAEVLDENDLLIQIVMPTAKAPEEALATASRPVLGLLADLGIDAGLSQDGILETPAGRIGHVRAGVVESALAVVFCLTWNQSPGTTSEAPASSLAAEMEKPIGLAELAELFLAALESHFSLELFPSLPTPDELEAIYTWDQRLVIEAVDEPPVKQTATTSLQ